MCLCAYQRIWAWCIHQITRIVVPGLDLKVRWRSIFLNAGTQELDLRTSASSHVQVKMYVLQEMTYNATCYNNYKNTDMHTAEYSVYYAIWLHSWNFQEIIIIQCVSKIMVIHFQGPIVLKSIYLNIFIWHISKEQLIFFPLVAFLHHVCHAWPSTLPLKMTMSVSNFCKFCELDKSVIIAKQCNRIAAEIVTSHASWYISFLEIWNNKVLATFPCDLEDRLRSFDTIYWMFG